VWLDEKWQGINDTVVRQVGHGSASSNRCHGTVTCFLRGQWCLHPSCFVGKRANVDFVRYDRLARTSTDQIVNWHDTRITNTLVNIAVQFLSVIKWLGLYSAMIDWLQYQTISYLIQILWVLHYYTSTCTFPWWRAVRVDDICPLYLLLCNRSPAINNTNNLTWKVKTANLNNCTVLSLK